jgi:hypothetical protein
MRQTYLTKWNHTIKLFSLTLPKMCQVTIITILEYTRIFAHFSNLDVLLQQVKNIIQILVLDNITKSVNITYF